MTPTPALFCRLRMLVNAVLVAACLLAAPAPAQTETDTAVDLAPRWVAGQTSRYGFNTTLEQTIEITLGDNQREQTTRTELAGEVTWVVDRVTDAGGARCTMTLDWMSVVSQSGDTETEVDSRRSPPADGKAMHKVLKAMSGVPLEIAVAPDGRVTKVKGLDGMIGRVDDAAMIPSELDFEETASGLAQFAAAPPPLAPGDTWDAAFRWSHDLGHVEEDWRYRLDGVEDLAGVRLATITGTAKSKLDIDPEHLETPDGSPPVRIRLDERDAETRVLMDLSRREAVGRYSRVSERVVAEMKLPHGVFRRVMQETDTSQLIRLSP